MKDEVLERIFSHPEMQKIPLGSQSTALSAFIDVLKKMVEENSYVTINELFESSDVS